MTIALRGDIDRAIALTKAAFDKERAAANLVANEWDFEPTRSILHRSAAVLAIECAELREVEQQQYRVRVLSYLAE